MNATQPGNPAETLSLSAACGLRKDCISAHQCPESLAAYCISFKAELKPALKI